MARSRVLQTAAPGVRNNDLTNAPSDASGVFYQRYDNRVYATVPGTNGRSTWSLPTSIDIREALQDGGAPVAWRKRARETPGYTTSSTVGSTSSVFFPMLMQLAAGQLQTGGGAPNATAALGKRRPATSWVPEEDPERRRRLPVVRDLQRGADQEEDCLLRRAQPPAARPAAGAAARPPHGRAPGMGRHHHGEGRRGRSTGTTATSWRRSRPRRRRCEPCSSTYDPGPRSMCTTARRPGIFPATRSSPSSSSPGRRTACSPPGTGVAVSPTSMRSNRYRRRQRCPSRD
jgi:hypothetical protein